MTPRPDPTAPADPGQLGGARKAAADPSQPGGARNAPADPGQPGGALVAALDRVGDRWSLLLVEALLAGPRRFNELGEAMSGIAPNILSDRLRRLERAGIVVATPYSRRPVRMEYSLTVDGRELAGALHLLAEWGSRHGAAGVDEPLRHQLCGTPLEAAWHCPTCDRLVSDAEPDGLTRL